MPGSADTWSARCFTPRAAAGARARIRWSARSSCRPTASSSGRATTSAPASRTPKCTRSTEAGARARGATLYCTLEPCCHQGRTGPCVSADRRRRHRARRRGRRGSESRWSAAAASRILRAHGVDVDVGLGAERAAALNQPFFTLMREGRPFVILKAATSLDGRIAAAPGRRTLLTSAAANRHAHRVRAEVDAIGVGSRHDPGRRSRC